MDRVRVGFVGAGSHSNAVHYPSLAAMEDVDIVAVCDLDVNRLRETASRYSVRHRFVDYRKMIREVYLDAVYIIMPPHQLYDIVLDVLEEGLNVFIEKPPGITRSQTESMAQVARRHGCKTMVGFNRRFIPLMLKARRIVEEGGGRILQGVSTFYKFYGSDLAYYRGAVDVLTCDVIHAVDMLRWMCGDPVRVVSVVKRAHREYYNMFFSIIEFEGGSTGILLSNWISGARIHTFEMHSEGWVAMVDPDREAVIYGRNMDKPMVIQTQEAAGSADRVYYYGFYGENRHFIDCIKEDRVPQTSFEDAARTMKLVEEIYRSSIT